MANIRINALPADSGPNPNDVVPLDNGTTRKTTIQQLVDVGAPVATQAQAEAGTNNTRRMTPLATKQAIEAIGDARFATLAQLEGQVEDYVDQTEDARDAAVEARDDAESARDDAEDARDVATSMAGTAEGAASTAQTSAGQAMGFRNQAETARDFAARWASDPEDGTPIDDGDNTPGQSSFHWSEKSKGFSILSEAWATGTEPGGTGTKSSREHAEDAAASAATINLPLIQPGDAGKQLFVNEDEDGYLLDDAPSGGLDSVVTPMMYGAAGDGDGEGGGTDDGTALQAALDNTSASILDLNGRTYRCDAELTISRSDLIVRNGTIDFSNFTSQQTGITIAGSLDAAILLTANAISNSRNIDIADTSSLAADDYLILLDDEAMSDQHTKGEFVRVREVATSTLFRAMARIFGAYTTGNNARVQKVNPIKNVWFEDVKLLGPDYDVSTPDNVALSFDRCVNSGTRKNTHFVNWTGRGARFTTCYDCHVDHCYGRGIFDQPSNARGYGVQHREICWHCTVSFSRFEGWRHGVGTGGSFGTNRFGKVSHNHFEGCLDGSIDAHRMTDSYHILFNTVRQNDYTGGNNPDGIIYNGSNPHIEGNMFYGVFNSAIRIQNLNFSTSSAERNGIVVVNNTAKGSGTAVVDIRVLETQSVYGVRCHGNMGDWTGGARWTNLVNVSCASTGQIIGLSIIGCHGYQITGNGLNINAGSDGAITDLEIASCTIAMQGSTGNCIRLAAGTSNRVRYGSIMGCSLSNGALAISGTNTNDLAIVGNVGRGQTQATNVVVDGTNTIGNNRGLTS